MNILLILGQLVITGYVLGWLFEKTGLPKIVGYIITGIIFSPNTIHWMPGDVIASTETVLSVCLGFITFEVGGELKWAKIQRHEREIIYITLLESLFPFILIGVFFYLASILFPGIFPFRDNLTVLAFAILLAPLASPTDPTATLAVIHQYNAKGSVKDTILGVAALDDGVGIVLFSFAVALASHILGFSGDILSALVSSGVKIGGGVLTGVGLAYFMNVLIRFLKIRREGQIIVVVLSLIILCYGLSSNFQFDPLLACMAMGATMVNSRQSNQIVFDTIGRYTEELIFLFFFVLSGLKLNVNSIPAAILPIILFIVLRTFGKFSGSYLGASRANAEKKVKHFTAGGLIPQGGIVIGLALVLSQYSEFSGFFELLLAVIMGATVIHELIGPVSAKFALMKAGEIKPPEHNK